MKKQLFTGVSGSLLWISRWPQYVASPGGGTKWTETLRDPPAATLAVEGGVTNENVPPGVSLNRLIAVMFNGAVPVFWNPTLKSAEAPASPSAVARTAAAPQLAAAHAMFGSGGSDVPETVTVTGVNVVPGGTLVAFTVMVDVRRVHA